MMAPAGELAADDRAQAALAAAAPLQNAHARQSGGGRHKAIEELGLAGLRVIDQVVFASRRHTVPSHRLRGNDRTRAARGDNAWGGQWAIGTWHLAMGSRP